MTDHEPLVLVAEDDPLASMALRAQLEALGYRVVGPAQNGDEAVALALCYPIDLALFDQRMPRRSGLDAARAFFDDAPAPVVLLTGVGHADLPDPVPGPPVFHTLTKPVDLAELEAGLRSATQRFQRWIEQSRRTDVADRRAERATIAAAVDRLAAGDRAGPAAVRFLRRAADEEVDPVQLARSLQEQRP